MNWIMVIGIIVSCCAHLDNRGLISIRAVTKGFGGTFLITDNVDVSSVSDHLRVWFAW